MLSEQAQLLLTGFVDGVLAREEREAVEKLLRESSEARAWLRKLQDNVHQLKKLPRRTLGPDFTSRLQAIVFAPGDTTLAEPLVTRPKLRRGVPNWVVGTTAAGVVACLVGGAALWVREQIEVDRAKLPVPVARQKSLAPRRSDAPDRPSEADRLIADLAQGAARGFGEYHPEPVAPPAPEPKPVRFAFADLQRADAFDSLRWELGQLDAVRIEVSAKTHPRTFNRLIEALRHHDIVVAAPAALPPGAEKKTLLVYAENVAPEGLAKALRELGEADVQGTTRQPTTYEAVRLSPGSIADENATAKALGADLKTPAQAPAPQARGVVVVPGEAPAREVRDFVAGRSSPRPGTIRVYLHLQTK